MLFSRAIFFSIFIEKSCKCTCSLGKEFFNLQEDVNTVNRLATKGEKISLTADKMGKKLPTGDKKIN